MSRIIHQLSFHSNRSHSFVRVAVCDDRVDELISIVCVAVCDDRVDELISIVCVAVFDDRVDEHISIVCVVISQMSFCSISHKKPVRLSLIHFS